MTHQNKEGLELLPCPFCGSEPHVTTYETESLWSHDQVTYTKVECPECEVAFHSEPGYELEAPNAWNRRAPDATSQAQLKIYREALEPFADFGELLELETEGFSDTDRLELVPEESDVRIGELFIAAFRRARTALSQEQSDASS